MIFAVVSGVGKVGLPRPEEFSRNYDSSGGAFNKLGGYAQEIRPTSLTPDSTVGTWAQDFKFVYYSLCAIKL